MPIPQASPGKTPPADARRLPCCSGKMQCRSYLQERVRQGEVLQSPKARFPGKPGPPEGARALVSVTAQESPCAGPHAPLRSLQPPSPRLTCAPLPRIPAPARQLSSALPLHCLGHPESRDRAGAFVKEGPQGEIPRRHHRDMHRAMHRAMHRSLHRYMPAPPGAATGPL